jgi:hypothetical protein
MEEWWGRLWWTGSGGRSWSIVKERMKEREVRFAHNGSTVVWMDLCGHEVSSEWVLIFLIFLCLMERIDIFKGADRHTKQSKLETPKNTANTQNSIVIQSL